MHYMKRCLTLLVLCAVTSVAVAEPDEPRREPKRTVAKSDAVDALHSFQDDPLNGLPAAQIFTTYVKEDGEYHVSMTERLVPWMVNRNVPQRTKALLLSAYVAGNFQAQLEDESKLDDTAAGLRYTVEVYEKLKQEDPTLMVAELDELVSAKEKGNLSGAIDRMIDEDGGDGDE